MSNYGMKSIRLQIKLFFAALLLLTGCSVLQPVHEALPPETLGPWGFRIGILGGTAPTIATELGNHTETPSYGLAMEGFRFGIGLGRSLELDFDSFLGGTLAVGSSVALRWQIMGQPLFEAKGGDTALTLTVRNTTGAASNFTSTPITQGSYYSSDFDLKSNDLSLVLGHRFANSFGGYVGAKGISGNVNAKYRVVKDGPVTVTQSRDFNAYGGLMGLYLAASGTNLGVDLIFEGEYMNLPSTYTDSRVWASNYSVMLGFPFRF
jgi:hypothetical protein